jgi:hypothetical protein
MNIKEIKQEFSQTDLLVIKRFLAYVNGTAKTDSDFANDASLDQLNQFSDLSESDDDDIKTSVREYLRLKKVRLRGNFTNN